jgi:hypothetical protein
MMQEHQWKVHGSRYFNIWESIQNLIVGWYGIYFEFFLNSTPEKSFEEFLSDRQQSGSFHSGSGMQLH